MALLTREGLQMEHDQRMAAATKMDAEGAARIIRHIAQIESDIALAVGHMSEQMMGEAAQAIGKVATSPWQVTKVDWAARVVCPEWKMIRGVGTGDAWLELTEIREDEEESYSWVGVAVRAGPTQLGLEFVFRPGLQAFAETAVHDDKLVAPLLKLGMVRDASGTRLFFPIDIKAETLAQGFATNDLDKALVPVGKAMESAIKAKAELDRLLGDVRSAATRK